MVSRHSLLQLTSARGNTGPGQWLPTFATLIRHLNQGAASGFGTMPPLPTRRVVVTGLGMVTPLAVGVADTWRRLLAGESGIRQILEEDLPEPQRQALTSLPSRIAGLVPKEQLEEACRRYGLAEEVRRSSRFMLLGLLAAEEALADARWQPATMAAAGAAAGAGAEAAAGAASGTTVEAARRTTGVVMGNGMSCTTELAEAGALVTSGRGRRVSPYFVPRILPNMAAGLISIRHGFLGPNQAPSTACATGGHAVGDAFRLIQRGEANVMVCGASEACVDAVSITGFSRLKALSTNFNDTPTKASRPFDVDRDGFVMGEGSAALVLEEYEHAVARGADIYAEVRGYGLSGDGHHITHPHPDGRGALLCMQRALEGSGLTARDLAYINAHATSTPTGDAIEQTAIHALLSEATAAANRATASTGNTTAVSNTEANSSSISSISGGSAVAGDPHDVAVSSTKGATGHLLGAAGAVEAAFTVLALRDRRAPPTLNLQRPDPPLLSGLVGPAPVDLPRGRPIAALSNSFGFGGTNSSLLCATLD